MKIDRFVKTMLVLIAVLLALNCATGLRDAADAQSSGAKFGYIHIGGDVLVSGTPGIGEHGIAVYDLRNGNMWGFPTNNGRPVKGNPVYLGTLDLSALDKSVGK